MDVHIGEMTSTVRMTDAYALLSPQLLEQIVQAVLARLHEVKAHEGRVEEERRLRPAVSARETSAWE